MIQCVLATGLSALLSRGETNATTFRRGDRAISPSSGHPPTWWDYRSGFERTAMSWGAVLATILIVRLWAQGYGPALTRAAILAVATAAATAGWHAATLGLNWTHRRHVVVPLARGVARYVHRHDGERPRFVHVPADWFEPGAKPAAIDLPYHVVRTETVAGQPRSARYEIETVCERYLQSELAFTWADHGRRPQLLMRPLHAPPDHVLWTPEHQALIDAEPDHILVPGLAAGGELFRIDLRNHAPHMLIAAGTGAGKSVMVGGLAAQMIRKGATATMLDFKRVSVRFAKGLPGVEVVRDIGDINDVLVGAAEECMRRLLLVEATEDDAEPYVPPRHLIVLEEVNATTRKLDRWWKRNKPKGGPGVAPGIDALAELAFMSREVNVTLLIVSQSGTVRALGNDPAIREQLGAVCMSRFSLNAARMLASTVTPLPRSSTHPGRFVVVCGGRATAIQVPMMNREEMHAYAALGASAEHAPVLRPPVAIPMPAATEPESAAPVLQVVPEPRYTLGQAATARLVPYPTGTYESLKKHRQRDPDFPAGQGKPATYTEAELQSWYRNRERAPASPPEPEELQRHAQWN